MSKVIIYRAFAKDTFPVAAATVTTGWLPGQGFSITSTGEYAQIGVADDVMFIGVDDDLEVSHPPTGSLLTGIYGSGTKFVVDHSAEVAAGSATRAYSGTGNPESGAINANLYLNASGAFSTTATGSVKGKMFQVPAASNNFGLGVVLRF